jgi:predicted HTH transcriptional regulator
MPRSVDVGTLRSLIECGKSAPDLAYVSTWHPNERREVVELASDVAGIESVPGGGHIVVGVDDRGGPSVRFRPRNPDEYQEEKVRAALATVLEPPINVSSALHELDGHFYLLIAVDRHPDGFRIMARDGQYGSTTVWRRGDVLVRPYGTSTRWDHERAHELIEQVVNERIAQRLEINEQQG